MKKVELSCRGTVPGEMYTREDGIRLLCDFQDEIIRDYRTRFNKSLFNRKYFTRDLKATADGYGLGEDPGFQDLKNELDKTSEVISSWRNGLAGEDRARRALSKTLPGEEMEALYGVSLRSGKEETRYDAIVITPYGVFAIEVRSSRDVIPDEKALSGMMNLKECLLRNRLRDLMNIPVYSILLIADNRPNASGSISWIPISYMNTVMSDIRSYSNGRRYISADEIRKIKDILQRSNTDVLVPCPVDCVKIAEAYQRFVSRCSEKSDRSFLEKLRDVLNGKPAEEAKAKIA